MFETVTLANGVRVVWEKIPFIRSVSFGIWVRNGSRNEKLDENGISHFTEHMLFKGTENRKAKDIADEIDAIGGQLNAYTTKEYTTYFTRVLDNHFEIALNILADMFLNSKFDDAEIEKEKNVIYEEINMYEDTPEELVHDILQSAVWEKDSLGYPILGTMESIEKFNKKSFVEFCNKNYLPQNTVIAIAGNFDESKILKKIEKYFVNFKANQEYSLPSFNTEYKQRIVSKEKDIEQLHLCLSFPGLKTGSKQMYDLAVLNTLFGGGMSSRLFQNIREDKGMVYSIYSYSSSYSDAGLVTIYAALNAYQCETAVALIVDEIKKITAKKIDEKTLYNTKEQLKSNYMLSLESSSNRMSNIGRSQLLLKKTLSPDDIMNKIEEVDVNKIFDLCNNIFDLSKLSLSAVGKLENLNFERMLKNAIK